MLLSSNDEQEQASRNVLLQMGMCQCTGFKRRGSCLQRSQVLSMAVPAPLYDFQQEQSLPLCKTLQQCCHLGIACRSDQSDPFPDSG